MWKSIETKQNLYDDKIDKTIPFVTIVIVGYEPGELEVINHRRLHGRLIHNHVPKNYYFYIDQQLKEALHAEIYTLSELDKYSAIEFKNKSIDISISHLFGRLEKERADIERFQKMRAQPLPHDYITTIGSFVEGYNKDARNNDGLVLKRWYFDTLAEAKEFEIEFEKALIQTEKYLRSFEPERKVVPVPDLDLSDRFRGHWIIGTPGTGKTQLLLYMLAHDLDLVARGRANVIVLDPTGTDREWRDNERLIPSLVRLKRFAPGGDLYGKLIIIDPSDDGWHLPTNLMAFRPDLNDDDAVANAIDAYTSIISGINNQPFTDFQRPVFSYVVEAALAFEAPTIDTVRDLLRPGSKKYQDVLPRLEPEVQNFFNHSFESAGVMRSRNEILTTRLETLTSNRIFRRVFQGTENRINFDELINQPKVIVINASRSYLKGATETYGRFFLSLITSAGIARSDEVRAHLLPCFVYIDECSEFIKNDANAAFILTKLRGSRMALIFGNQETKQIDEPTRGSFLTTGIKYVNSDSASANFLADSMKCEKPERLVGLPPLHFAAFITGKNEEPFTINVPYGWMDKQPKMDDAEFEAVRNEIRKAYYVPLVRTPPRSYDQPEPVYQQAAEPPPPKYEPKPEPPQPTNPSAPRTTKW